MNYKGAVRSIEAREKFGVNLGLSRIKALLSRLSDPQDCFKSILIAGTNGKGSTAAMLSAVLTDAGYRTGLYTSPHFFSYTERIRLNEKDISPSEFASAVSAVEKVLKKHKKSIKDPTVFEILTAAAFLIFAEKKVDIAILEVGLGGRLDATNTVKPLVSVITNVDLDHTDVLGESIAKIAKEKAGIIKKGVPVVTAAKGAALNVIFDVKKTVGTTLRVVRDLRTGLTPPLIGRHQKKNLAVALGVLNILKSKGFALSENDIKRGLKKTRWRGRFEIASKDPLIILDGAHNPAGARALRETLVSADISRPATLIMGILSTKDVPSIARELVPFFDRAIATKSSHLKAASALCVAREAKKFIPDVRCALNVKVALDIARASGKSRTTVVTGSLFTVADALRALDSTA
jgi:dihydrofolate synthase/folylpolyglutamate synthase